MDIVKAIVLGVVQGVTEFLPISSTAHLKIVPALLHWKEPSAASSAVIQLGTVAAVLIYFAKDLLQIATGFLRSFAPPGVAPPCPRKRGSQRRQCSINGSPACGGG